MTDKLKMWSAYSSWKEAEEAWESGVQKAGEKQKLKKLSSFPSMPGITKETAKNLKWKSFKWMVTKDHQGNILQGVLKKPFRYAWSYLKSLFKKKSYEREGDFFLYGIKTIAEFEDLLRKPDVLLVIGFSYCHKPFECPSKRFSPDCIHDPENPVCRQCFIGKIINALPVKDTISLIIPTVHYIGGKMFEVLDRYPDKKIVFLITACEMTLEMFGDWGNMIGVPGIGVRLDGRICNTMKAFELSEEGIKPGLTVVREDTKQGLLNFIKIRW